MDGLHLGAVVALVLSRVRAALLDDAVSTAVWAIKLALPVPLPWPFGPKRQAAWDRLVTRTHVAVAEQRDLEQAVRQATLELDVLRVLIDAEQVA